MKKKTIYISVVLGIMGLLFSQCNQKEFLSVANPSATDDAFVTSSVSEAFKTLSWCYAEYRKTDAAGGNYNWNDPCSDAEYYPEYNSNNGRIGYLRPAEFTVDGRKTQFNSLYQVLGRCARIGDIIGSKTEYLEAKEAGVTDDWTQLYGEAWTFYCYCYFELVRHFGDIPFGIENSIVESYGLTSRFEILDKIIAKLKEVEPLMYDLGQGGITAERMSRTFAHQLIAEAALYSGAYQTIRTDSIAQNLYGDIAFTAKYTDNAAKAAYVRRNDYKDYYRLAQTHFRLVLGERKGSLSFITTDERDYCNNPFQRGFQYMADKQVSPESIWEAGNIAPNQSERPYSQGRPSDGGGSNAAPCKVFSGIRIIPTFYYTGYEDGDKRMDPSMVVTGSDGKGNEKIINFKSGSRLSGGIAVNKWDDNRMNPPYVVKQRNSGMNYVMRRISNTMLLLAEVDALLGDETEALSIVNQIRDRAFGDNLHRLSVSGDALKEAISREVAREFVGEGDIRWEMIRTGTMTDRAKKVRRDIKTMIAGLEADGYYTFANGRVISNYIWTKPVNKASKLTYDRVDGDPALVPGWRGVYDYSTIPAVASIVTGTDNNLAIKGLFEYIDPTGAEAAALEADGYTKTNWGIDIISGKNQLWDYNILSGIELTDVPLYYHSIPLETMQQSQGRVTNGYGLPQL